MEEGSVEGEAEWPDDGDEAAFLSENGPQPQVELAPRQASSPSEKLPDVDELVARIPPGVIALLDDLFRAKFTTVRKFAAAQPAAEEPASKN
ncbi:MAG TPA: hypothetical protein VFE25_01495 [Opitutaceae bacterium]|nr:hypothetical protein [Opitutaceae bacterium]